jgi:hypothetical protein
LLALGFTLLMEWSIGGRKPTTAAVTSTAGTPTSVSTPAADKKSGGKKNGPPV